jgi:hypothetical protein
MPTAEDIQNIRYNDEAYDERKLLPVPLNLQEIQMVHVHRSILQSNLAKELDEEKAAAVQEKVTESLRMIGKSKKLCAAVDAEDAAKKQQSVPKEPVIKTVVPTTVETEAQLV